MTSIQSFTDCELKTSFLKVFSYDGKNPTGTFFNPHFGRDIYFQNLTQLLFIIEGLLDETSVPQRCMQVKTFERRTSGDRDLNLNLKIPEGVKTIASFKLSILFRQNASWQGSIVWIDRQLESTFRSTLEMISLMDNVLSETEAQVNREDKHERII